MTEIGRWYKRKAGEYIASTKKPMGTLQVEYIGPGYWDAITEVDVDSPERGACVYVHVPTRTMGEARAAAEANIPIALEAARKAAEVGK